MRAPLLALLLLSLLLASPLAAAAGASPTRAATVRVESGLLAGAATDVPGVRAFLGVPYARPPIGTLRWRPPQPPLKWSGVRTADRVGPCCQQVYWSAPPWTEEFVTHEPTSEDCLTLNVWTADSAPSERAKRPVLVWLHGGSLTGGSGAVSVYDGAALAARGLVVVTINYRLGALGFLAHPALSAESRERVSGDYGLLDCIAALRWVRRNAAAFGGDTSRVTLAGQSSGATLVSAVLRSPLARGLVHRAILMSGSPAWGFPPLAEGEAAGAAWARTRPDSTLPALRARPAVATLAGGRFGLVADGWCLPAGDAIASDVPILFGVTADEPSSDPGYGKATAAGFTAEVRERLGPLADEALRLYPFTDDREAALAQKQSTRDQWLFEFRLWALARAMSCRAPGYAYCFARATPWPEHPEFGAFHSSDVPYAFANLRRVPRPWEDADRRLSDTLASYWVRFAATGDPNGPGLPEWPAFDAAQPRMMELDTTVAARPMVEPRIADFFTRCRAAQRR